MPSPKPVVMGHLNLQRPVNGARIPGRTILFQWEAGDLPEAQAFRLTIKPLIPNQTAATAMSENKTAFETTIEHVRFFVLDAHLLDVRCNTYAWTVAAIKS